MLVDTQSFKPAKYCIGDSYDLGGLDHADTISVSDDHFEPCGSLNTLVWHFSTSRGIPGKPSSVAYLTVI